MTDPATPQMASGEGNLPKPRVLFVYYTHTQQSLKVSEAMADVLRERGCDVSQAGIEFTDPHYARKFSGFPFRHAVRDLLTVLPAQVRRKTGQIQIPDAAREGDYDLVCFGSPTWFFTTNMPLRSYLKSDEAQKVLAGKRFAVYVVCRRYWSVNLKEVKKLGTAQGATYVDGTRFTFEGRQIRSLLALLSYFGKGEMRDRYLGVKIPPTNLKPDFADQAQAFANELANNLAASQAATGAAST
jgi:menaquinone-dependent protoporphyrinogen IX oxidase